jgi:carboxymethylenebutenolidase
MSDHPRLSLGAVSDEFQIETGWLEVPVRASPAASASTMTAYLARPTQPGRWPAVLVGFEMFGITGFVRQVADRLARTGYLALVPDYYHWQSPDGATVELPADAGGRERGLELINGLDRAQVRADVQGAMEVLATRPDCSGEFAIFGMSAGAHISFYAGTQFPLAALILLYPGWLTRAGTGLSKADPLLTLTSLIGKLGTPVLFLAGSEDHLFAPGQFDEIRASLTEAGVRHVMVVYPGVPHGFFCDERETYRPEIADDAWARTTRLLAAEFARQAAKE